MRRRTGGEGRGPASEGPSVLRSPTRPKPRSPPRCRERGEFLLPSEGEGRGGVQSRTGGKRHPRRVRRSLGGPTPEKRKTPGTHGPPHPPAWVRKPPRTRSGTASLRRRAGPRRPWGRDWGRRGRHAVVLLPPRAPAPGPAVPPVEAPLELRRVLPVGRPDAPAPPPPPALVGPVAVVHGRARRRPVRVLHRRAPCRRGASGAGRGMSRRRLRGLPARLASGVRLYSVSGSGRDGRGRRREWAVPRARGSWGGQAGHEETGAHRPRGSGPCGERERQMAGGSSRAPVPAASRRGAGGDTRASAATRGQPGRESSCRYRLPPDARPAPAAPDPGGGRAPEAPSLARRHS